MTGTDQPRILLVASTLHIGGAEQVIASLSRYLRRSERVQVSACYLKAPGLIAEQMLSDGVDLVPIPGLKTGHSDYLSSMKLRQLIRARRISIIHTHDVHGLIDGSICRLLTPGVRHIHTFHFGNYPNRSTRYRRIERALWRVPDALVAVGRAQAAAIKGLYAIPDPRIRLIANGVEAPIPETDHRISALVANSKVPVLASVSTLIPQKGLNSLIEAAAILRREGVPFKLLLAGDGVLRQALTAQVRELGLTAEVTLLGWVPRASNRLIPFCDVFVQPSLWEAMSVVLLEASAAGKPIVATTVGDNAQVVQPGLTGLLVPPAAPRALAGALKALLLDRDRRLSMGRAGKERFGNLFTVERMVDSYEQLYVELARTI